tara:strand:+ start:305 stop:499 length:195 start_codon:yes stop_codon:yes gene_type:complete
MSLTKRWIEEQMEMGNDVLRTPDEFDDAADAVDEDEYRHYEEQERKKSDDRNVGDGYVDYTEDE